MDNNYDFHSRVQSVEDDFNNKIIHTNRDWSNFIRNYKKYNLCDYQKYREDYGDEYDDVYNYYMIMGNTRCLDCMNNYGDDINCTRCLDCKNNYSYDINYTEGVIDLIFNNVHRNILKYEYSKHLFDNKNISFLLFDMLKNNMVPRAILSKCQIYFYDILTTLFPRVNIYRVLFP